MSGAGAGHPAGPVPLGRLAAVLVFSAALLGLLLALTPAALSAFVAFLVGSLGCLGLHLEARRRGPRRALAGFASLLAVLGALEAGALALDRIESRIGARAASVGDAAAGRDRGDRLPFWSEGGPLGYEPAPARLGRAREGAGRTLDVDYVIDANGLRATRSNPFARCAFLFYGDAFVFGEGLSGVQTLPYRFSEKLGFTHAVFNLAFPGYGPHQMLRSLELGLERRWVTGRVGTVFYVWLPGHAARAAGWDGFRQGPRYVLDATGEPRFAGRLGGPGGMFASGPDAVQALLSLLRTSRLFERLYGYPELGSARWMTWSARRLAALVASAQRIMELRHGARLVVIAWGDGSAASRDGLDALGELGITVVEARDLLVAEGPARYLRAVGALPTARAADEMATALANRFGDCFAGSAAGLNGTAR